MGPVRLLLIWSDFSIWWLVFIVPGGRSNAFCTLTFDMGPAEYELINKLTYAASKLDLNKYLRLIIIELSSIFKFGYSFALNPQIFLIFFRNSSQHLYNSLIRQFRKY